MTQRNSRLRKRSPCGESQRPPRRLALLSAGFLLASRQACGMYYMHVLRTRAPLTKVSETSIYSRSGWSGGLASLRSLATARNASQSCGWSLSLAPSPQSSNSIQAAHIGLPILLQIRGTPLPLQPPEPAASIQPASFMRRVRWRPSPHLAPHACFRCPPAACCPVVGHANQGGRGNELRRAAGSACCDDHVFEGLRLLDHRQVSRF